MAISKVGVVYDYNTKEVRRIIVPDNDWQLDAVIFHDSETEALYKCEASLWFEAKDLPEFLSSLDPVLALL